MFFEIFNHIYFDNEMNIISCLDDEYVRAEMTAEEILEIIPEIKKIKESKNFYEIQSVINDFIYDLPVSQETVEQWEKTVSTILKNFLLHTRMRHSDWKKCAIIFVKFVIVNTFQRTCCPIFVTAVHSAIIISNRWQNAFVN